MDIKEIQELLLEQPINRSFRIHRAAMDEENRTAQVAFASDLPIQHWFGRLILSMDEKSMRAERLQNGAALLLDHNMSDQIGVVENFQISNGVARAQVRFSRSARGEEIFQDVRDGIRQNISVGFMIHQMDLESTTDGEPIYRSNDWEPYEISLVSVPADISVGVGRSQQNLQHRVSDPTNQTNNTEIIIMPNENGAAVTPPVADDTSARHAGLIKFAELFGSTEIARDLILADPTVTLDDVRHAIMIARDASRPVNQPITESPGDIAARHGAPALSLARSTRRYGKLRGFTGEGADERAFRFGQFVLAGPLQSEKSREFCAGNGIAVTRAQSEGVNEKGGYLVPEDFGNDLIDLIETYGVFRQNAKLRPMSSDTASDPRIIGELDAYFVGESTVGTESDFETDRVNLTAKKLMTLVNYSSEVSEDSAIMIGDEVARLSARAFAKKEDLCGFVGDGTSTYGGIIGATEKLKNLSGTIANIAGLKVGSGNAYSELTLADFRGVVAKLPAYADQGAKWFVHKTFYWDVMVGALFTGGGVTATEIENTRNQIFLGYPVVFSQVMPKVEANSQVAALFGDLMLGATLGDRRAYTIALSEHARFTADDWVFRATSRFDINVHSVGNASATAADRVPGPIVGLIMAAA